MNDIEPLTQWSLVVLCGEMRSCNGLYVTFTSWYPLHWLTEAHGNSRRSAPCCWLRLGRKESRLRQDSMLLLANLGSNPGLKIENLRAWILPLELPFCS